MKTSYKILLLFLFIGFHLLEEVSGQNIKTVLQLDPGENNPRNSEGDFIRLKDGRIMFIYTHFTGSSSSDFGSAHLAARFSRDNGQTWTDQDKVIVPNDGKMNVMSVSLLRLQNGDIALFYARKNSLSDCIPLMRISKDEGETWSEPTPCITDREGYFVLNNNRVLQLDNGRLIMPVALHRTSEGEDFNNNGRLFTYFSDDNGATWKSGREVRNPKKVIFQEPGLIALKNGKLMMIIRTDDGVQYAAFSKDLGEKWTPAKPTKIASPLSPATIARIPSTGDLIMVWNNNGVKEGLYKGKRTPLNVAISKDEGKTWEKEKVLEDDPDGWYCYTAIHFVNEDQMLLSYCAGNRPAGTGLSVTRLKLLNLGWVYED
ncbi:sialidase family protein [Cyclobacterium marinum]|uniref:sialidase family protein n=1 Tax=Cyclobacterium marinum TaxID=104 RepID=UPI0011EBCBE3|nr:sialidase family protein [Cyclobacterium marinum]MBI0399535.1 exo-alpha-sialidase [Cyclobacterium marinum]